MDIETIIKVRGLLCLENKVLLCYNIKDNFFFLPGGSLEKNENIPSCLTREFKEEMALDIVVASFLGCVECHWQTTKTIFQEINMVFKVEASKGICNIAEIHALEKHISFHLVDIKEVVSPDFNILPACMVNFFPGSSNLPSYQFENQILV